MVGDIGKELSKHHCANEVTDMAEFHITVALCRKQDPLILRRGKTVLTALRSRLSPTGWKPLEPVGHTLH